MPIPGPESIVRTQLDNGITLLVHENHASPSAVVTGYVQAGAADESREQAGLAAFAASALLRGTAKRSFETIFDELESVGASASIGGGVHSTGFGGMSLAEDLPLVLDVLADALRDPAFPKAEVEKLRGQILTDLHERAHDTQRMSRLLFRELAYPSEHPYSRSVAGYSDTVGKLRRNDLARFHAEHYSPEGLVMVIVGAIPSDKALRWVEEAFGDWQHPRPARPPVPEAPRLAQTKERALGIPGKTQADVVLGYPGPARTDPGFLQAALCNCILGVFGMMGRLGEKVREEQGLAYYSYSRVSGGPGPGPWSVTAGVEPANVAQAVESIQSEIRRMREEPVGTQEMADNKAYLTGSLPLRLETNSGQARTIRDIERYDLGLDYLQRYKGLIEAITAEEVQEAARSWLDPDAYALAVAGPAEET
jgi:zinc protease